MALDFAISVPSTLVAAGVPTLVTITLTGTGSLATAATFTATGTGSASAAPTLPIGSVAGATTSFNWTAAISGVMTVTASGGLTTVQTLVFTVPKPNTVSAQMIIDQSLGILGVKSPGQVSDAGESQDCLLRLNMLVDALRPDPGFAYATPLVSGFLKAGVSTLTIGPSGDIVTAYRPVSIEDGSYFRSTNLDFPMSVITDAQYQGVMNKGVSTLGPGGVNYSPDLPNGTLTFYPRPMGDVTVYLQVLQQVTEFENLTTLYVLAPGYRKMLAYSLAEEMAPDYMKDPSPVVSGIAAAARRSVRKANYVTPAASKLSNRGNIYVGWEH